HLTGLNITPIAKGVMFNNLILDIHITCSINKSPRILTRPLAQQSQAFILFLTHRKFISI
ncbi:TPA: hypothetical protein ACGBRJ_000347, partial [Escherichia coli]|uniref:hypothetical protein n=1 Tax=Escherichia coli TaxID=562 RepID=UPI001BC82DC8